MWRPLQSAFSFSLRCTVFLLNAAVFADLALYLAVGGLCLGLVELSCPLTQFRASSTSGTDSSAAHLCVEHFTLSYHFVSQARQLEICNIEPGDCAAVCSRSGSFHLATALLSARGRASVCSGPCCESSSGPSVLASALVVTAVFCATLISS